MNQKLRSVIGRARLRSGAPNKSPAVVHVLMTEMRDDILRDAEILDDVLAAGLGFWVRDIVKKAQGADVRETASLRAGQLDMWPEECRAIIRDIAREAVFVPSREEYVELVPDALSAAEIEEAGNYLIGHGRDCIARGNALLRLVGILRDRSA